MLGLILKKEECEDLRPSEYWQHHLYSHHSQAKLIMNMHDDSMNICLAVGNIELFKGRTYSQQNFEVWKNRMSKLLFEA